MSTEDNPRRDEEEAQTSQAPQHAAQDPAAQEPVAQRPTTGRQRLLAGLWPPRVTRAQLIVALLLFVLGLGLAIQVRSNSDDSALRGARQEDLVRILDELDDRTQRLEDEKQKLDDQKTELENSSDQAEEARKQTLEKERQLGVLGRHGGGAGARNHVDDHGPALHSGGGHAAGRDPGTAGGGRGSDPGQ